ncbi:acyl-CoA reductase-like NAD-dependent aldehyde dehydrogenase [Nocardioides zeae]|uniref:Acyl-CoA reductase-like NAD-dependent aldehyde dehydrogenase n=1 Tax=Nocardioides zeae TaxID=1457234 RepID=A0ACC6IFL1_9ACTN|nr:aldehyde dehydrogenase family protein [Nocardioides zeae]MDR6176504.1 acyl-CoA reductase-like NAD-dependent aldehyde dehydrogenase [Nocardioides zeae]MDR6209516.1 acyl-CoA reductase-like NAD-dependent aldehyde dehydrogenase [Nocardioides zeae]
MTTTSTPPSATEPTGAGDERRTFASINPATGDVVGVHPVHDEDDVRAAVARARASAGWWADLGFAGRREVLTQWRGVLTRRLAQLGDVVHQETGKPHGDAQLECTLTIDHLAWAGSHAEKVLGRKRVSPGLLLANQAASVEYLPLGVVGVIGPWNYPVFTPMGSIGYALAAGNTVVFKPSELTPGVAHWLADSLREVVPDHDLLQVVTGFGDTGAALCRAGVDKVAFTGSTATGKRVMAACAETLTPVIVEAGGKDALLVDEDADLDAAADAAAWGAFANAGQTCAGVERIYVHERVQDRFVELLAERARTVHAGVDVDAKIGPMTMPGQLEIVRRHVDDALSRGGRAVVGGAEAVGDRFVQPMVLVDVPEDSAAVTEETFGPTVTVRKVRDMDEAVELTNAGKYGLGSAIFTAKSGEDLARRLRTGMTSINSVISFAGVPSLPFGGVGDSGFGRIHGPDGLREFTYAKSVTRTRFKAPINLTTFERTPEQETTVATLLLALHGRASQLPKLPRRPLETIRGRRRN